MSVRTFTRRFGSEVGLTPGKWLTVQRVQLARQLLESSDRSGPPHGADQPALDGASATKRRR
jgi:AraC-like DNA-binding protein